jgi:purine-nucleoside/S-methyl-5'-thioadenosine phosphorylase / adenosine deaminase
MVAGVASHPAEWALAGGVRVRSTGWAQGDLAGTGPTVEARRRAVSDRPWTVLKQVHGARVALVESPGGATGEEADAAVTVSTGAALAVLTADCAPVALASPEGVLGIAHAGWRGLRAGVIESTVQAMRRLRATRVEAVLGPCIHRCCYTFGEEDLADMAMRVGPQVRARDSGGRPALDLPAGVKSALHAAGASLVDDASVCTCCSAEYWSWRSDRTPRRQATVVWRW